MNRGDTVSLMLDYQVNGQSLTQGAYSEDATMNSNAQALDGVTSYSKGVKYTGNIQTRSSSDYTVSGNIVTGMIGFYPIALSASVSGSSWTHKKTATFTSNYTSTSAGSITTVTVDSSIVTKDKIIWVRIRDNAGKRNGYFTGSDSFFINYRVANGSTSACSNAARLTTYCASNGTYGQYAGSYGVYPYSITNAGVVNIYGRYSSSNSLTINGTFTVDIFTLDYPTGYGPVF